MQIKQVRVEYLNPYENNPRNNDEAVDAVAASIKEFGFKVPIVITSDNVIIAGHTRLKAAKKLGLSEVPCIIANDLSDEQVKAFRLADNRVGEIAKWDEFKLAIELENTEIDMKQFGFTLEDIAGEGSKEIEDDNFDVDQHIPKTPFSKKGDVFILGEHRVMCGDSTIEKEVDTLVDGGVVDLLQTDPPYNVDYGSKADAINKYGYSFSDRKIENDHMPSIEFVEFLTKAFANAAKHMKKGASFYIWHASTTILEFELALRYNNLKTRQQLIWNKSSFVLSRQDYHWKHEPCLYGWKEGAAHYFINDRTQHTVWEREETDFSKMKKTQLVDILEKMHENEPCSIFNFDKPRRSDEHPTMKPIKLIGYQIQNSTHKGETVLDLFGGSGSSLIACEETNRKSLIMEYDEKFVDVIVKRWFTLTKNSDITLLRNGKKVSFDEFRDELGV